MKITKSYLVLVSILSIATSIAITLLVRAPLGMGTSFGNGGDGSGFNNSSFTSLTVSNGGSGTGAISTTTSTFGSLSTTTSATCFNMKTNLGASTSVYVVGTTLVVESGNCK